MDVKNVLETKGGRLEKKIKNNCQVCDEEVEILLFVFYKNITTLFSCGKIRCGHCLFKQYVVKYPCKQRINWMMTLSTFCPH